MFPCHFWGENSKFDHFVPFFRLPLGRLRRVPLKHQKYLLVTGKNAKHGLDGLTKALERFDKKFTVYYRILYPLLWSERRARGRL